MLESSFLSIFHGYYCTILFEHIYRINIFVCFLLKFATTFTKIVISIY
jgi:hypothetical protein